MKKMFETIWQDLRYGVRMGAGVTDILKMVCGGCPTGFRSRLRGVLHPCLARDKG